jgi:preprotein translocase subunit SecE
VAEEKNKTVKTKKSGSSIGKFLKETYLELKKVVWPTKKQLTINTIVVIVASIIMALLIMGFDSILY